jgi:hypothetical protein
LHTPESFVFIKSIPFGLQLRVAFFLKSTFVFLALKLFFRGFNLFLLALSWSRLTLWSGSKRGCGFLFLVGELSRLQLCIFHFDARHFKLVSVLVCIHRVVLFELVTANFLHLQFWLSKHPEGSKFPTRLKLL